MAKKKAKRAKAKAKRVTAKATPVRKKAVRKAKPVAAQGKMFVAEVTTAPCVPKIQEAVQEWRKRDYPGITDTTEKLLNHWFFNDHFLPNGQRFSYHPFQREAIETIVYLYEVAGKFRSKELIESYATQKDLRLLQYDLFPRYCLKLATGTGKTKVISLAIAWQYFNAVEDPARFAATTLLIAPNVIVFERLKNDFEGGRIFMQDPVIPPELRIYWDHQSYMRGEPERAHSQGALYVTNVQQLYEARGKADAEPDALQSVLGPKPSLNLDEPDPFFERILARGNRVLVANDEAHHTHEEDSEWSRTIRRLHEGLEAKKQLGVVQLDMSATPRFSKGALFPWTVYDYPLKQAIMDRVVKRPFKGVAKGLRERRSDIASQKYQMYLTAGVKRWQEYRDKLKVFRRKPVLFIMMNSVADADEVGDYLKSKYPDEFGGDKLQVIHTDTSGEVKKKDVEEARRIAKEIDDSKSPVNCVVSVLMLREGWDVQSVTVVVGLRPYTAKANILPEQAIGRGLRLMFRGARVGEESTYQETLDVIGNDKFIKFVEDLEKIEGLEFETVDLDKEPPKIEHIYPDPEKLDRDIVLPVISPILTRKTTLADEIAALDVSKINVPRLPKKQDDEAAKLFRYEGYDIITLQKMIEREYKIPEVGTSQEVIGYYAKRIASTLKLPSQFAALVPKIREFLQDYAFGEKVDLDTPQMIQAISSGVAEFVTEKAFVKVLRERVVQQNEPQLENEGLPISSTEPYPWSRATLKARKTVFNLCAAGNTFEYDFCRFLEGASEVVSFAKLSEDYLRFSIPYIDSRANLRAYHPDFVAVTKDGVHHIIETKGREDLDVQHKDRAAIVWCENATMLTGTQWAFHKILQEEFTKLRPEEFEDLVALEPVGFS
ncbi:MAG: DEAD/DEAH box helicase family protein [Anaerolineales bacterium]|nr:MAG: DEAD/DEAH box helicase family protein [Anaerolineales bacterium]